jgi:hypothetical protein
MQLSAKAKNTVWITVLVLTAYVLLLMSSVWSVRADTRTATLTATAQVTAVPTPLMPTVIQHGLHMATRELPLGVTVHTQQISATHIRVTIIYY